MLLMLTSDERALFKNHVEKLGRKRVQEPQKKANAFVCGFAFPFV